MVVSTSTLDRTWSLDDEIKLLSLVCDFKPAGKNKHKHMETIVERLNGTVNKDKKPFSTKEIWDKLKTLYNLKGLDDIEDSIEEDGIEEHEASKVEVDEASTVHQEDEVERMDVDVKESIKDEESERIRDSSTPTSRNNKPFRTSGRHKKSNEEVKSDTSDLSDGNREETPSKNEVREQENVFPAEGEEQEDGEHASNKERVEDNEEDKSDIRTPDREDTDLADETTPKRTTRATTKKSSTEISTSAMKKRTRSSAKLDTMESGRKKSQKSDLVSTPSSTKLGNKRRTRSGSSNEIVPRGQEVDPISSDSDGNAEEDQSVLHNRGSSRNDDDNHKDEEPKTSGTDVIQDNDDVREGRASSAAIADQEQSSSHEGHSEAESEHNRPVTRRSTRFSAPSEQVTKPIRRSTRKK